MATNKFIMTSGQLQPGDVVTETGLRFVDHEERQVKIESIQPGELWYRDGFVPVHFVVGTDLRTKKTVRYASNGWRRWVSERRPVEPVDRAPVEAETVSA
jgi:hypothetical protein